MSSCCDLMKSACGFCWFRQKIRPCHQADPADTVMGSNQISETETYLPFDMGYLTPEMVTKAELELGETDEIRKGTIKELRTLIKEEPKLYCPDDDAYLLQYLRARKFNTKRAFNLLQNYYHVKRSFSDIYSKPDFVGLRRNLNERIITVLPYRDKDGCVTIICQLYRWNPDDMKFGTFIQAFTAAVLLSIEDPATQVCGVRIIMDVKGLTLKQLRNTGPRFLTLLARALRNCLPVRFKSVHIYNESYLFQYVWNILRMVLTEKIKNRFYFHSDNQKALHEIIPPAILTEEYGGTAPSDNTFWLKKMDEFEAKFATLHKYGYRNRKGFNDE